MMEEIVASDNLESIIKSQLSRKQLEKFEKDWPKKETVLDLGKNTERLKRHMKN